VGAWRSVFPGTWLEILQRERARATRLQLPPNPEEDIRGALRCTTFPPGPNPLSQTVDSYLEGGGSNRDQRDQYGSERAWGGGGRKLQIIHHIKGGKKITSL